MFHDVLPTSSKIVSIPSHLNAKNKYVYILAMHYKSM